ncbi:MAG: PAS domain-containing protein [Chloroflexi bacterium]|nr:PAS domain-containing protein [Chloroflexota bacterium]
MSTSISRHGDPALLDREAEGAQAVAIDPALRQALALPLIFAGVPLGLLIVFRTYSTAISPNDVQMLQSFADQAAIAVKNAQLYAAVSQERQQLQAILDHSADGVMILDRDLTIQQFNEALVRMTGWNQRDAVGADHDAIIRWAHDEHADLREVIDHGLSVQQPRGSRAQYAVRRGRFDLQERADVERRYYLRADAHAGEYAGERHRQCARHHNVPAGSRGPEHVHLGDLARAENTGRHHQGLRRDAPARRRAVGRINGA